MRRFASSPAHRHHPLGGHDVGDVAWRRRRRRRRKKKREREREKKVPSSTGPISTHSYAHSWVFSHFPYLLFLFHFLVFSLFLFSSSASFLPSFISFHFVRFISFLRLSAPLLSLRRDGFVFLSFFFCLRPEAAASSAPSREAAAHSPVFHRQPVATESGVSSTPPPPQLHLALDRDPVRVRAQDLSVSIQRCRCYQIIGNPFRLIRAPMISIDMIDFDWREP